MSSKDAIKELNELIHDSPVRLPVEVMKGLKDAVECIEDMDERIAIMEAETVIHCKDCKNAKEHPGFEGYYYCPIMSHFNSICKATYFKPDFHCGYGKPKEGELG